MKALTLALAAVAFATSTTAALAAGNDVPSTAFDGRWAVSLSCADTQDKNGLVKGYEFTFVATITGGKLQGQYGSVGSPSSLVYTGEVAEDGTLEIRANGNTGSADYTIGRTPRGTAYGYTMAGKLGPTRGEATRREARPCTARLAKL